MVDEWGERIGQLLPYDPGVQFEDSAMPGAFELLTYWASSGFQAQARIHVDLCDGSAGGFAIGAFQHLVQRQTGVPTRLYRVVTDGRRAVVLDLRQQTGGDPGGITQLAEGQPGVLPCGTDLLAQPDIRPPFGLRETPTDRLPQAAWT